MKISKNRSISYNKSIKLWELHDKKSGAKEFVKSKTQATQWLEGEIGNGDCYEVSAKHILYGKETNSLKNAKLCHGTVCGQGPLKGAIFGHSWVEYEQTLIVDDRMRDSLPNQVVPSITIVLDKSNGRTLEIPAPIYYLTGKIDPTKVSRYSQEEIRKNILKHGHWGPW